MAMLDIAKVILASEKKQIPETYKEILKNFSIFYFNQDFGEKIAWFAIMRNIITHEYLDVRWKRIKKFLVDGETLIPLFIKGVKDPNLLLETFSDYRGMPQSLYKAQRGRAQRGEAPFMFGNVDLIVYINVSQ